MAMKGLFFLVLALCGSSFAAGEGFVRVAKETAALYHKEKAEYWRQMDEIVALCRKHDIKLVPSLGVLTKWHQEFDEEGVALIALWAWHFPWQEKDHNITTGAEQPLLMKRVAEFNRRNAPALPKSK